jgi:hypothetical protein
MLPTEKTRMEWNPEKSLYEQNILLKQGYYSYQYVTRDIRSPNLYPDPGFTEGNYFETENEYLILVYTRNLQFNYDELIGARRINSITP